MGISFLVFLLFGGMVKFLFKIFIFRNLLDWLLLWNIIFLEGELILLLLLIRGGILVKFIFVLVWFLRGLMVMGNFFWELLL